MSYPRIHPRFIVHSATVHADMFVDQAGVSGGGILRETFEALGKLVDLRGLLALMRTTSSRVRCSNEVSLHILLCPCLCYFV